MEYAREWVSYGHMLTDDQTWQKKKPESTFNTERHEDRSIPIQKKFLDRSKLF